MSFFRASTEPDSARLDARIVGIHASAAAPVWTTLSESAGSAASPSPSTSIPGNRTAVVYALSVVDQHEFFANGVLVSNCDAALYSWRRALPHLDYTGAVKAETNDERLERLDEERLTQGGGNDWWDDGDSGDFD